MKPVLPGSGVSMVDIGARTRVGLRTLVSLALFVILALRMVSAQETSAGQPAPFAIVHAVIFYSPTCPHCHQVMTEVLPPLVDKYGKQFVIIGVDVTTQQGQDLYQATVDRFGLEEPRLGVPTLVVGSTVMVGDREIPTLLPGLIDSGLAAGGVDWPPVPAVRQALATQGMLGDEPSSDSAAVAPPSARLSPRDSASTPDTAGSSHPSPGETGISRLSEESEPQGPLARFRLDPVANSLAVLVLLGMVVALATSVRSVVSGTRPPLTLPAWTIPVLAAVGMAVASYLALVEIMGSQTICGPVGNCNAVQQSHWALLFGIPVGMLGQAGYLAMFGAWVLGALGPGRWKDSAWLALWVMALGGTGFSVWLTFLEPFVIGATCVWCLTSAVVLTLILQGATPRVTAIRIQAGS